MNRVLPAGAPLAIADGKLRGHVRWTTDVPISILANTKPVIVTGQPMADIGTYTWMSLTQRRADGAGRGDDRRPWHWLAARTRVRERFGATRARRRPE